MDHFNKKCILGLVAILLFGSNGFVFASEDSITQQVYVLVNSLSKDSKEIANFYITRRGIPESNILALEMSLKEEITLEDYVQTIHNPLLEILLKKKLVQGVVDSRVDQWGRKKMSVASHEIAFLVTTKGVPLKFTDFSEEKTKEEKRADAKSMEKLQASVDSELSSILLNYYSSLSGPLENKFSENRSEQAWEQSRIIRTARLDGPSVKTIKKRIEDSIYAEEYGLYGRAYFDLGGPYKQGDEWISKASEWVENAYYEIDLEPTKALMGYKDRLDAPAIYMGWYKQTAYEQWKNFTIKVPRGAIAYHLHSYSATTIRTKKKAWVGPLLEKGYASTFGYVYEPFLGLTVRPDLFIESLLAGNSLGEAYFFANPAISWQSVLIGDPLYRPFLRTLSEQLEMTQGGIFKNYVYLNEYYKNKKSLGEDEALAIAKKRLFQSPNLALMFTVGRDLIEKEAFDSAIHVMRPITLVSDFQLEDLALVDAIAQLLLEAGKKQLALKLYKNILFKNKLPKALELKLLEHGLSLAYLNGDYQFSSMVNKRILELEPMQ
jgi:uncharacterized protein (TIGR03790 family)